MGRIDLATLDPVLGPATALANPTPTRVVLAALCRGLDESARVPPRTIRLWLRSRRPDTRDVIDSAPAWHRLVRAARGRVGPGGSSSPEARAELQLQLARRLLGHLIGSPCLDDVSTARATSARGALAVIGVGLLRHAHEKGWDSLLVTGPWLAVQMGVSRPTAEAALRTAVDAGWLRIVKRQKGGARTVRLARLGQEARGTAWSLYDEVEEAADHQSHGDTTDPDVSLAVQLLFTADHPVWGYSEKDPDLRSAPIIGRATWLIALADALGVDPAARFGFTPRAISHHRRHVDRLGLDGPGERVVDRLDEWAERTGAMDRYRAAEEARRAAADERRAAVRTEREKRANARAVLEPVLAVHRIPEPEQDRSELAAWASGLAGALREVHLDDPEVVAAELARRLSRAGFETQARTVAETVLRAAAAA